MTTSNASARLSSRPLLDLVGIAENVTSVADPAALVRELLAASVQTLKNPAGLHRCQRASGLGFCGGASSRR